MVFAGQPGEPTRDRTLPHSAACAYRNHSMKTTDLTVTRVGHSRGIRLPAEVLRRLPWRVVAESALRYWQTHPATQY